MIALAGFPCGIALLIFARHPSLAGSVHEVLRTEDVHAEKELRILNGTVHMALCREVDDIVDIVLSKELVDELTVANVAFDEEAPLVINIILDRTKIACISERVEDDDLDILIRILFMQEILNEV